LEWEREIKGNGNKPRIFELHAPHVMEEEVA